MEISDDSADLGVPWESLGLARPEDDSELRELAYLPGTAFERDSGRLSTNRSQSTWFKNHYITINRYQSANDLGPASLEIR